MSILEEAQWLISGDRHDAYGDFEVEAVKVAAAWSAILGHAIEPRHVPLCMIALKLVREAHAHKRDSLVDICGYAALTEKIK